MQTEQGGGFYKPAGQSFNAPVETNPEPRSDSGRAIEWDASEYLEHAKGAGWMILVGVVALILVGVAIFFKQWTFAVLLVVMAVAFGYFGFRKPQILHYRLSSTGINIGQHYYPFKDFRSFGVVSDGAMFSITLIPVKRFAPGVNVFFPPEQGESIVDIIGAHLTMQKMSQDPIDRIMRNIRF